ncbi:hypothetical protein E1292_46530 [Nonomuraea deserti]|uniref:Uncharacterized protein n=1 Tax=Nonomuraea deserti TaxID=1848322 RepID=A0A4R4UG57_9ACTN|nr:hypothetical protein [Nonomuraea deserti]TDC87582.1 hypothetical protein E1292_46530 [Nonomuraea deserti]
MNDDIQTNARLRVTLTEVTGRIQNTARGRWLYATLSSGMAVGLAFAILLAKTRWWSSSWLADAQVVNRGWTGSTRRPEGCNQQVGKPVTALKTPHL